MQQTIKILFSLLFFLLTIQIVAQQTINNQFVIDLVKKGLDDNTIITVLQSAKSTDFEISKSKVAELKAAGVSDRIISIMLATFQKASAVPLAAISPVVSPVASPSPAASPTATPVTSGKSDPLDPVCYKALVLDRANTPPYLENLCSLARNAAANNRIEPDNARTLLTNFLVSESIKRNELIAGEEAKSFFLAAEKARTDKQTGSGPGSSGTTSLAVKGGAPSVIGWAVEQGAATSSISGTTVTVRVNPFGLFRAIQGEGFLGTDFLNSFERGSNLRKLKSNTGSLTFNNFLRNFSTGFSFDTTRGQETPTFIVSKQQLSAISARYEFINERTPQSKRGKRLFADFVPANTKTYTEYSDLLNSLYDNTGAKNKDLKSWLETTNLLIQNLKKPTFGDKVDERRYQEEVRQVIENQAAKLPVEEIFKDPSVKDTLQRFAELTTDYVKKRKAFSDEINKGAVVAFEYTNYREPIAPDTSNFRFIWEKGILGKTDLTFNASLTMYNKKPTITNIRRLRDFQFALQTETPLGDTFGTGETTLSFAGRYERVNTDIVDPLGIVTPNSKGDVAVGQIKFTIPIADWGIKLPLSMTFANRSEFIKESTVRGNFGITFDLDPLFARLKPF